LQDAFQRARIGFQLGLAERLAIRGLGRGQDRDRGQFELVGFARSGARCGLLARAAGGRGFLFLVFFFVVLDGSADQLRDNADIKEFYLGLTEVGARKSYRDVKHYKRRKRWLS